MWNERRWARKRRVLQRFIQRRRLEENHECGMNQKSRKGRSQSLLNDYYKPGTRLSASHTKSHLTLPTTPRNRHQKLHGRRRRDLKRSLTCPSSYREQNEEEHKFQPGSLCFKTHAFSITPHFRKVSDAKCRHEIRQEEDGENPIRFCNGSLVFSAGTVVVRAGDET